MDALARLAELYSIIEVQKAALLNRSTLALRAVEYEMQEQAGLITRMKASNSKALIQGRPLERFIYESERECATWNVASLEIAHRHREEVRNLTLCQYRASLLKKDQMDAMLRAAKELLRSTELRREQASLDDRFIARSSWLKVREERRIKRS